jgi:DNA-binding response OmpR family regulator
MTFRILICDDDIPILRASEIKFRRAGFDVICAQDGEEALELIRRERPDALITDCQMPRMDGLELCRNLRKSPDTQSLPIVMLTAKGFELSADQLREELGIACLLAKPFSPRELLEVIESLLSIQQQENSTPRTPSQAPSETSQRAAR